MGSRSAAERLLAAGAVRVDGVRGRRATGWRAGRTVEVELPAAGAQVLEPRASRSPRRLRGRAPARRRQAGRRRRPSRRGPRERNARPRPRSGEPQAGTTDRPGSCTGSTATRRGSWSSRAPRRRTSAFRMLVARPRARAALPGARPRPAALLARTDRGADRPRPRRPDDGSRSTRTTPREAVTHFEVAELLGGNALLDVRLETGRTHQIRVHLGGDRPAGRRATGLRRAAT